jgi:predicted transcriptional regulator
MCLEGGSIAMKQRRQGPKAGINAVRVRKLAKHTTRSVRVVKPNRPNSRLETVLSLIRTRPGIRPSELNRLLNLEQSDALRSALIKRGLVRKEKDGSATRYYPV